MVEADQARYPTIPAKAQVVAGGTAAAGHHAGPGIGLSSGVEPGGRVFQEELSGDSGIRDAERRRSGWPWAGRAVNPGCAIALGWLTDAPPPRLELEGALLALLSGPY